MKTNLQAGRVRLIFIADEIPPELRRVVEFLNSQMDPAEVLAIEVKQFVGEGLKTLVPRVLGQTETARQKKSADRGEKRQWDEPSFFDCSPSEKWRAGGCPGTEPAGMGDESGVYESGGVKASTTARSSPCTTITSARTLVLGLDLWDRRTSVSTHEPPAVLEKKNGRSLPTA